MISRQIVLCAFSFGALIVNLASAADLPALGKLLTPAYTAMSLARLCEMNSDWATAEPRGPKGNATNYAEYAKNQVIESLTYDQSVMILQIAADAAKTEARKQLHEQVIVEGDKSAETIRFRNWCAGYVRDFVADFIGSFEHDEAPFRKKLQEAKQAAEP